jgi:hypothetical protein
VRKADIRETLAKAPVLEGKCPISAHGSDISRFRNAGKKGYLNKKYFIDRKPEYSYGLQ